MSVQTKTADFIETGNYVPGVCNIGPEEIQMRTRAFYSALILAIIASVVYLFIPVSPWWGLLLVPVWIGTGVSYLQVRNKFCVYFGIFSVFNFDKLGNQNKIEDAESTRKDKRKVREMILQGTIFGIIVTAAFFVLKTIL